MLYYLDTMIVIYAVEGSVADKKRAKDRLDALEQAGRSGTGWLTPSISPPRSRAAATCS